MRHALDLDRRLMAAAIRLARRGLGRTAPNPAVGAVIYDPIAREVVGRGWTQPGGRPHAEPEAIARAGDRARGAWLYVTLEPCSHHGRTPPCAEAIIAAGIARVIYGIMDPDPRVAGRGLRQLAASGIDASTRVLSDAAYDVTLGHILRVSERRPFVQLKIAVDRQGLIATGSGDAPRWVTGETARARGHLLRAEADAILVGRGTVAADDPSLDCRLPGLREESPMRVVLAGSGEIHTDRKVLKQAGSNPTVVMVGQHATAATINQLQTAGADVQVVGDVGGRLWIPAVLEALIERGITRLLVEGGPAIWQAFDRAGMIDEAVLFRGGHGRDRPFDGEAAAAMLARYVSQTPLTLHSRSQAGDDDMIVFRRS